MANQEKKFYFNSGINISFQNDAMKVNTSNFNSSIDYVNIVNFTFSNVYTPRLSQIGLATRILVFGWIIAFILVLPVDDEWGALFFTASKRDILLAWSSIIIAISSVLISGFIFLGLVFSVFMEISFLDKLIEKYFSDHRILSVIGNKSGKNIQFYALNEEISKVKAVNEEILSRKKTANEKVELIQNDRILQNDFHSDLKKLNELLLDCVITQEEFDLKKKQILGI